MHLGHAPLRQHARDRFDDGFPPLAQHVRALRDDGRVLREDGGGDGLLELRRAEILSGSGGDEASHEIGLRTDPPDTQPAPHRLAQGTHSNDQRRVAVHEAGRNPPPIDVEVRSGLIEDQDRARSLGGLEQCGALDRGH